MAKLTPAEIRRALKDVPGWKSKGAVLRRTYQFKDFVAAMRFVERVARLAEKAWHHPDIDIRWNRVELALTTHDEGGLTEKDFALAKRFDAASRR
jgi:4a-hydroxytetrahydrobiopterin dehydratase